MSFARIRNLFGPSDLPSIKRARRQKSRRRPGNRTRSIERLEDRQMMATFTVINTADAGAGSLRQAILDSNANAGADLIAFAISASDANFVDVDSALAGGDAAADAYVIRPTTALPALTDASGGTTMDGRSQTIFGGDTNPFGPEIVLDGSLTGATAQGLELRSDGNQVLGLNIQGFTNSCVFINGGGGNTVAGNYLGTDATGTASRGYVWYTNLATRGVLIQGSNNTVGGTTAIDRNLISGNYIGVMVFETGNLIQGNYVGTNAAGTAVVPNFLGVGIYGGAGHTIGGAVAGAGNLISGNDNVGAYIDPAAGSGNLVQGNYIGTNAAGSSALGNLYGVSVLSSGNIVGGNLALARNIISGNRATGVNVGGTSNEVRGNYIGTDVSGTIDVGNQYGVAAGGSNHLIGGTTLGSGNLISGNDDTGVYLVGSGSRVEGNTIGTNVTGTAPLSGYRGVLVQATGHNVVGGTAAGAGNLITAHSINVHLFNDCVVQGNTIGTDITGTVSLGSTSATHNVYVQGARNLIGGTTAAARNLIAGGYSGIYFVGGWPGMVVEGNQVQGNYIGTDRTGTIALGNGLGVAFYLAWNNTVGGTAAGASNLIAGNLLGIDFQDGASSNVAQGNLIGLNAAGTAALGNAYGVRLYSSGAATTANVIGGTVAEAGNVIAGNSQLGVWIDQGASGTVVQGNAIGTDASGAAWGNNGPGVMITGGASDNVIGGIAAGAGNAIAFNTGAGVSVTTAGSVRNTIRGNSLHDNGGLGIDLGAAGVTANDAGDADTGANQLQNYPVLAMVTNGAATHVTGSLNSTPNTTFNVDFYANIAGDPSGYGEGKRYLGSTTVTTDASGNASFAVTLAAATAYGELISSTATDPAGNTSEFSANLTQVNQQPTAEAGGPYTVAEGGSVVLDGSASSDPNQPANTLTYEWDLDGDTIYGETGAGAIRGDETGAMPTFSAAGLDGPSTVTVSLRVTDNGGLSSTDTATINVTNADPTATNNAYSTPQATPVLGNVITDNTGSGVDSDPAGANDPLVVSSFTNPSNGTLVLNPNGSFTYSPDSTFSGIDSFSYTISDGDGGFSTATVTISVTAVGPGSIVSIPDTCEGGTALLITGTATDDHIVVEPGVGSTLKVTFNGVPSIVPTPSGRIIVLAGGGNDDVQIAGGVNNTAWVYGEAGDDKLHSGGGASLLLGGDGNDQLHGGSGRDILVGGNGADKLIGNSDDDILIAGFTTKDERTTAGHEEFWCDVMEEWNSTNSFNDRVNNLRGPATQQLNNHNGASYLLPNVVDDAFGDDIDFLNGSSGLDWLIYRAGEDKVSGQQEANN